MKSNLSPLADERIECVGLTFFARTLRRGLIRNLDLRDRLLVIKDNGKPIGVLLGYQGFLALLRSGSDLAICRIANALGIEPPAQS